MAAVGRLDLLAGLCESISKYGIGRVSSKL